jgi:hypothetical protein
VRHFTLPVARDFSCDLHVLGTPLAFVLSQDQTLQLKGTPGPQGPEVLTKFEPNDKDFAI